MNKIAKLLFGCILLMCNIASAGEPNNSIILINNAYVLLSSALVMVMTPGLALFYAGMVRNQNLVVTMMHSFIKLSVVSIIWFAVGYSLAFSENSLFSGLIGDLKYMFLDNIGNKSAYPDVMLSDFAVVAFQGMFAVITAAIITGSFAERVKLMPVIIFASIWIIVVYAPIAHWVWGNGWLHKVYNTLDFAGGTVVHVNSAVAGLVAAIIIGKRNSTKNEPQKNSKNIHLTILGAGLLWFGWFGFNAGSALTPNEIACLAFVNTNIAAAAGAFSWMLIDYILHKRIDILGIINGAVAGLVAITPAAGYIAAKYGFATGIIAGILCHWAVNWLKPKLGYDDTLDVFGVHGIGGFWGAIATGIFASTAVNPNGADGLIMGNVQVVLNQIIGTLIVVIYSALATFIILKTIKCFVKLRATDEEENTGLDLVEQ